MSARLPEVGTSASFSFSISMNEMQMFAVLSGDDNPIHFDSEFATSLGLSGPIVYGGLLIAKISRLLGGILPGHGCIWAGTTVSFVSPLYIGEKAVLNAKVVQVSPAVGLVKINHRIHCSNRLILRGSSEAITRG